MLGQSAREGGVVSSDGEYTRNDQNRWPFSHGEIANPGPILGEHVAGILKGRLIHVSSRVPLRRLHAFVRRDLTLALAKRHAASLLPWSQSA